MLLSVEPHVLHISEADLGKLKIGQEAQVELDALPGQTLAGTLDSDGGVLREKEWSSRPLR